MRALNPDNTFVAPLMTDTLRLAVGEAPGEEEQLTGKPFVGGAGAWLDGFYRKAGVAKRDVSICNTIQCRPPDNLYPTDPKARGYISLEDAQRAVAQCKRNHVLPILQSRPWTRIDALGDKALECVTGKTEGIMKWRGSPLACPDIHPDTLICVPTLHPSYVARDQSMIPVVINDLRKSTVQAPENYVLYPSLAEVEAFTSDTFVFDIETAGWTKEIRMVGLADPRVPYRVLVVPFQGQYIPLLRKLFARASAVVGHNCIQFDLPTLREYGIVLGGDGDHAGPVQVWDTMLMQHLRFPDLPHDLEFVGSQFSTKPAWKDDKGNFELYCARDVDVTAQIYRQLHPMLQQAGLMDVYNFVSVPMARVCRLMHETGVKLDPTHISTVREKLLAEMATLERALPEPLRSRDVPCKKRVPAPEGTMGKGGKPLKFIMEPSTKRVVPWRSTDTKLAYLYGKDETWHLGADVIKDAKSGRPTTGKMALEKLQRRFKGQPSVVAALRALRSLNQYDETITTFAKKELLAQARQHPHFNVHGTNSGRLSSSDPNLQNVPKSARYIYVPSHAGWKFIDVDYSSLENRLTAYFANDTERLTRYATDPTFSEHKLAASVFFDIPYDEVVKDNDKDAPYGKAKRIVHGTNYGMGAQKIANLYDLELKECKELQAKWKAAIGATTAWQEETARVAKEQGFLSNPFGRKRWFYTSSAYTESLSFVPQSSGADVVFRAMIAMMYERIGWPAEYARKVAQVLEPLPEPARLLLQVHDSLLIECPAEQVDKVCDVLHRVMEQPWPELGGFSIPIEIEVGDSWGKEDLRPYEPPKTKAAAAASIY